MRTLAERGANALKVRAMAAELNVSRGSFYWHFVDIADFRAQLLRSWRDWATDRIIRLLETEQAEPDRLKTLLSRAFVEKHDPDRSVRSLDRAIRSWAGEDADVAAAVAAVDDRRVSYISNLLAAGGVEPQKAHDRAAFLYWAYLGQDNVMDPRHASIAATAVAEIGDLFET
ncbi:TetR/AcrR family transcriptional regulator [Mesorhizobium sp. M0814]|uniref:TetR/AcrR family transcriptional regulator n=1 Tax=Mesorhizobium sp. M0814 TaxID=2957004 RepID=UPI003338F160